MENEFEKYLQQNRDQFEKGGPSPRVWEKLQRDLVERHERKHRVIRIRQVSWRIAACILLCIGVTIGVFKSRNIGSPVNPAQALASKNDSIDRAKIMAAKIKMDSTGRVAGVTDNETRQSLYHYSRLIETREKQMAVLQKVNPDLYARSQKVLIDLNQQYSLLQKQLPGSPDQQKVLNALIQNLKMQEQILNNQLQLLEELQTTDNDGKKFKKI